VDVVAPPDEKIKAWAEAQQNGPVQATADVQPLSTLKALQDVRVTLRGEDGALVTDRILRKDESISTDGLGRWFVSSPFGGVLEANGYGQTALVGEAGKKVVNWRVPDFEAIAIAKSKAEAEAAAALAAAEAAKLAAQQAKDQPAVTQTTAPNGVNLGNTTIRPADPANASPVTATPASAKVVGPVTQ
jgi:hypothetical protein